jgi:hypothetical protein
MEQLARERVGLVSSQGTNFERKEKLHRLE